MKVKLIKQLLSNIYYQGIYDGIDIQKRPYDRFLGDTAARKKHEEEVLKQQYKNLRYFIKPKKKESNA